MARRKSSGRPSAKRRLSVSQIILYVISLIVIVGIAAGFVISLLPTPVEERLTVTPAPTFATLLPTPTQTLTATLTLTAPITPAEPPVGGAATPRSDQRPTVAP